jgi:DNA-binding transcriptional MocR family regulator
MSEWTNRVWREFRAGNLTRGYRDVLLTLRTFRGAGGLCFPSHATLADRAGCSPSTALRALQLARSLGLVSWAERRVRAGWRWLRSSNAYRLETPGEPVREGLRPKARRTYRKSDGGGESESKKAALEAMLRAARAAPDLLARRRAMLLLG